MATIVPKYRGKKINMENKISTLISDQKLIGENMLCATYIPENHVLYGKCEFVKCNVHSIVLSCDEKQIVCEIPIALTDKLWIIDNVTNNDNIITINIYKCDFNEEINYDKLFNKPIYEFDNNNNIVMRFSYKCSNIYKYINIFIENITIVGDNIAFECSYNRIQLSLEKYSKIFRLLFPIPDFWSKEKFLNYLNNNKSNIEMNKYCFDIFIDIGKIIKINEIANEQHGNPKELTNNSVKCYYDNITNTVFYSYILNEKYNEKNGYFGVIDGDKNNIKIYFYSNNNKEITIFNLKKPDIYREYYYLKSVHLNDNILKFNFTINMVNLRDLKIHIGQKFCTNSFAYWFILKNFFQKYQIVEQSVTNDNICEKSNRKRKRVIYDDDDDDDDDNENENDNTIKRKIIHNTNENNCGSSSSSSEIKNIDCEQTNKMKLIIRPYKTNPIKIYNNQSFCVKNIYEMTIKFITTFVYKSGETEISENELSIDNKFNNTKNGMNINTNYNQDKNEYSIIINGIHN